jgi:hypothetical protein
MLNVSDWELPDPAKWVTMVDFVQSPETLAHYYGVPLWSDEHFERIGASLAHLRRAGNKTVYLHLLARTNHGNEQTMVRWVRQKDGTWTHDFSIMEKYLDLYLSKVGKPQCVIFYAIDNWTGSGYMGNKPQGVSGVKVTAMNAETGEIETFEGPRYDKPEAEAFFRPVVEGIRTRLEERGLLDAWHIGVTSDNKPIKEVVLLWKKLAPEARWVHQGHGMDKEYEGVRVGYNTTVWKAQFAESPDKKRWYGWRKDRPRIYKGATVCWFHRDIWRLGPVQQASASRSIGEKNITGQQAGFGRMSTDFWPCLKKQEDGTFSGSLSSRFPESSWKQCNIRMRPYLQPGPTGAVGTVRFEMVIEGLQECEARIFIEKALLDKEQRARLGEERATRLQSLLDERTRRHAWDAGTKFAFWTSYMQGWETRSRLLFDAAAEAGSDLNN